MDSKSQIMKSMEPLFEKAKQDNLWLHSSYQDLWFSPEELEELQSQGKHLWWAENWVLKSPHEKIAELERYKQNLDKEIEAIKAKAGIK